MRLRRPSDVSSGRQTDRISESGIPVRPPDFADLGRHIAELVEVAEKTAEQIRADAREEASGILDRAREDAAARVREASERQSEAEEEARRRVAAADAEASTTREAAERRAKEIEQQSLERQRELQRQTRLLEKSRERALWELREVVAQVRELLPGMPEPESGERGATKALPHDNDRGDRRPGIEEDPAPAAVGEEPVVEKGASEGR
jgi:hypothetical protein